MAYPDVKYSVYTAAIFGDFATALADLFAAISNNIQRRKGQ